MSWISGRSLLLLSSSVCAFSIALALISLTEERQAEAMRPAGPSRPVSAASITTSSKQVDDFFRVEQDFPIDTATKILQLSHAFPRAAYVQKQAPIQFGG